LINPTFQTACGFVGLKTNLPAVSLFYAFHYEHGGLAALEHPQAMADKKTNPFIADKPDKEKTQDELLQEVGYLRAEVAYLKKLEALFPQKTATPKKRKSSKH
jgi:transposase